MTELATQTLELELPLGTAHANGLEIPENLPPSVFAEKVMQPLITLSEKIADSSLWWWGDALAYQEQTYGVKYDQALEVSGYSYQTLATAVFTCKRIEFFRRRKNLSYSHHADIASAFEDPAEQDTWLDRAEQEKLSVKELRLAIRAAKAEHRGEEETAQPEQGAKELRMFAEILIWLRRDPPAQWTQDRLNAWRKDAQALYELLKPALS